MLKCSQNTKKHTKPWFNCWGRKVYPQRGSAGLSCPEVRKVTFYDITKLGEQATIDLSFLVFVKHKDLPPFKNRDPNLLDIIIADILGYQKLNPEGSHARSVVDLFPPSSKIVMQEKFFNNPV